MQEEQLKTEAKSEEAKRPSETEEKPAKSGATGGEEAKSKEAESKSEQEKPAEVERAGEAEKPAVAGEEMMDEDEDEVEVKSVESA